MSLLNIAFAGSSTVAVLATLAVTTGFSDRLDRRLYSRFARPPGVGVSGKPTRVATMIRDITAIGGDTMRLIFLFGCFALLIASGRDDAAIELVVIFALARLILFLLKLVARRPRPDADGHAVVTYTSSFPSGHTLMAVLLFLTTALIVPSGNSFTLHATGVVLALLIGAAIGLTRLTLGIHWPSDVFVGWFGGIALACGAVLAINSII